MSMSTAADMWAGSRSPTSSTIGKLSVWSEARFWVVPPPPPPQATSTRLATPPTDRALRICNEVGVIAFPYQSLRPSLFPPAFSPVSSRAPRGERAPTRGGGLRRHLLHPTLRLGRPPRATAPPGPPPPTLASS